MRLDKIFCAAQTFVGHFRLFHFRILKKSKCIFIKRDLDVAKMITTKTGMLVVTTPED